MSYSYRILNTFFTLWSHTLNRVATGSSSRHWKECQTQYSIHSKLSSIMECRETNFLFKVPGNCVTHV